MSGKQGKEAIATGRAPAAVGPYSQAVSVGGQVYCSGQIALDPVTGELVTGGFEAQARRVMDNLGAVLEAAGLGFANVVKVNIYLTDLANFAALNALYAEYFREPYPARATVGVAALPKGAAVEIDLVAVA
jgi:reactive intermediate/imine deaminase